MKNINPNPFTTRPEIEGTFGVVTSTHWIATAVGMATLEKGGNAFDAAVATAFTLQVVEPHLNGPGGDVPVLVYDVCRGRVEVICGQGPAPAGASIAHYRSLGLDMVPGTGLLAACVPGMFDTWMMLLRDYGTMKLADVLSPAIAYANEGYPLVERASATIASVEQLFTEHWPTSAAVYLPDGKVPKPGTLFTNKALAKTYARVLREAESAGGDRVEQIEKRAQDLVARFRRRSDRSFLPHAGDHGHQRRAPSRRAHRRRHGALAGAHRAAAHLRLWPLYRLQGGPVVAGAGDAAAARTAVKGFDLEDADPVSAEFIHTVVECSKLAYADREKFYGDPDFVDVPMATLLSDAYNEERRRLVSHQASLELRPGSVEGFGAVVELRRAESQPRIAAGMGAGEPTVGRMGEMRRRHSAFRHRRPGRQHGLGDAVGRLAAILAGDPRDSASASARARRCSGWRKGIPPRLRPANGRAPRSRPRSRCATASRTWPGARPAATSRTNGRRSSSCVTCMPR